MQWFVQLKASCDAIDSRLYWVILFGATMGIVALVRWRAPTLWAKLPGRVQALPAALVAALGNSLVNATSLRDALIGALMGAVVGGAGAVGVWHVVKGPAKPEDTVTDKADTR